MSRIVVDKWRGLAVALRRARLVLGWVIVCGRQNHLGT